jgi:hypothetical protein
MRCDDIRNRLDALWGAELPPEVDAHLADCSPCSAYAREVRILREGLNLWKVDAPPAPSLGFAGRVVRQLGISENPVRVADFFELVGRRFVFGTLALALLAVLAFTLPSSSPMHSLASTDMQAPAQEAILASSDPMGVSGALEAPAAPAPPSVVSNEAK